MSAHPVLEQARAALRRDLRAGQGSAAPWASLWEAALQDAVAQRAWWLAQWADGAPHVLGLVAQDVQEAVHERDPLWPPCTETSCPERLQHALHVEPDLGPDPFWTCHRTGLPVAAVGTLPGAGPAQR
jgi:hypothetical protein